jgi:hypothetical protein
VVSLAGTRVSDHECASTKNSKKAIKIGQKSIFILHRRHLFGFSHIFQTKSSKCGEII